ncbi:MULTISPECIES: ABC transporter substrate-binding protein [Haloferax]|uniref:ABC transporter substrate-binding protein n=1 Tax=Haloferax marinum TaxID=2666143 RepID=A0A6A8G746_9EURY|nr:MULTISPECIES: ABC transporter substrate-binding protein [Haloferax]KAB1197860.1 ABC transporter substrate-binding protein [Haloferax sp. CBA1150]MRW96924.1 ABC transporter substrate-binding protein [Haloferax marinum]
MSREEYTQNDTRSGSKLGNVSDQFEDSNSRRTFLKALGVTGIAGLAGCTGGGESYDGEENGDETTASSGGGETETEGSDDGTAGSSTLRMSATQRFGTVDPAKGTDYTQVLALVNLYDPLVFPDTEGNLKPHLAEDWTVSDDNKTYTFTLREGVTFHSGNPVRAEDVKFSAERFLDINQGYSSLLGNVLSKENVTVEDDRTVSFTLDRVHSPFLATLVLLFVVDKKAVMDNAADGDFGDRGDYAQDYLNNNDAGSGPYELAGFERQAQISFSRYTDYWQPFKDGAYDNVVVKIITKDPTVRSLMKTGELDVSSQYQSEETYQALAKEDDIRVDSIPTVTMFYFKINTQKSPTDDPAVREAMAYGFDYETARNQIAPGSLPAQGPLAPSFGVHNDDIVQPTYDPEKAKQILADAGYEEGDITVQNTYVKDFGLEEKMGLLFQQNMDEIGINVELNPQTWGTMTELATSVEKTPHVNQVFYGPVYPSPDTVFYNQYHSGTASTWMSMEHLEDSKVDSLIDEARSTVDPDTRGQLYADLQDHLANLYPDLFIFVQSKKHAFAEDVQGYTFRPSMSFDYWFPDFYQE